MNAKVQADGYFAIIPEWLLDDGASGNAIKLYAILRRYADNETKKSYPSRKTLAEKLGFKNAKTVDPVLQELTDLGAVSIQGRTNAKGERQTSVYTVHASKSVSREYPLQRDNLVPENGQGVVPENGQELKAITNLEPPNSQAPPDKSADAAKHPADVIAKKAYDGTDGALKYMAVRAVSKWAIDKKRVEPTRVESGVRALYEMGKPVTNTTMGQYLDGHLNHGRKQPVTHDRMMNVAEMGKRHAAAQQLEIGN